MRIWDNLELEYITIEWFGGEIKNYNNLQAYFNQDKVLLDFKSRVFGIIRSH